MYFAPHTLYRKVESVGYNEHGNISSHTEAWVKVCRCRCDDNSVKEFRDENGHVFRPAYHIVCEGRVGVNCGDEVRIMDGTLVRGEGRVFNVTRTNWYDYTQIYV